MFIPISAPSFAELYTWGVEYTDGTHLTEIAEDGSVRAFGTVEMHRVRALAAVSARDCTLGTGEPRTFMVWLKDGQRPIFFRRRSIELNPNTGTQTALPATTCIGWQETRKGRNVASYLFICPDGSTILTSDPKAV